MREEDIDNNILIENVQTRPVLYDKRLKEYSNPHVKRKMWQEVCQKVFSNNWIKLTIVEMEKASLDIQKRWRNLRGCFARELRVQKKFNSTESNAKRRRKYIYYDQLVFLIPTMELKETSSDFTALGEEDDSLPGDLESLPEFTLKNEQESKTLPGKLRNPSPEPGPALNNHKNEQTSLRDCENVERRSVSGNTSSRKKKKSLDDSILEIFQNRAKRSNSNLKDQDTNFVLSLVPMLKSLPLSVKLEIQVEILKLFKNVYDRESI